MMAKTKLILRYVMIILGVGFFETKAQVHHANQGNQSRNVYYTTTFDQDISRRSRSSTELPVAFKAPSIKSQNFWNHNPPEGPNRRTFFEDLKYLNYGSSNVFSNFNSFFEFMSPLFDRERTIKPKPPSVLKPSEPYKYEYPFKYLSSTERNFLPPPKPLRASILKLETVTKAPDWQIPFRYIPPTVRLTQPSNILSQPIDQIPTLYIDELGFHSDHNINFRTDPNWIPQRTPGEPFDEKQPTAPQLSTDLGFGVKSMPIRQELGKNETYASTLISIEDITESSGNFKRESEDSVPAFTDDSSEHKNNKSKDEENSKKALQLAITNTVNKYNMINYLKINRDISNNTVSKNTEETELVKIITPYKSNAIKIVTDLTLEGLQKNKKNAVNVPRYTKLLNMSNLISYELNKLKENKLMKPRSDFIGKPDKESYASDDEFVNANDEFNLDLKILKDTNWDGFTTVSPMNFSSNAAQNDSETKPLDVDGENKSPNAQINSTENNENCKNQTIIVETRVTKSVSALLPGKNRYNRRKYYHVTKGRDPRKEPNIMNMADSDVGIEQRKLKIDVAIGGTETNAAEDITFKTGENENIQTEAKVETFNKTVITLGKKYEISQENSTNDNQTSTEVTVNYRSRRRKYRPYKRNRSSYYSFINTKENTPLPIMDITERKDEPLNSTGATYAERTNDYATHTTTENPQLDNIDAFVSTEIRRKKLKRTSKSKRRRMGKRRKSSSSTEKLTVEESTDTV